MVTHGLTDGRADAGNDNTWMASGKNFISVGHYKKDVIILL